MLEEKLETITLTKAKLVSIGGVGGTKGRPTTQLMFEGEQGEINNITVDRETACELAKHLYKTCNITIEIPTK